MTASSIFAGPANAVTRWLLSLLQPVVALLIAIVLGGLLVLAMGNNPIDVYWLLFSGSVIGMSLSTCSPGLRTSPSR